MIFRVSPTLQIRTSCIDMVETITTRTTELKKPRCGNVGAIISAKKRYFSTYGGMSNEEVSQAVRGLSRADWQKQLDEEYNEAKKLYDAQDVTEATTYRLTCRNGNTYDSTENPFNEDTSF